MYLSLQPLFQYRRSSAALCSGRWDQIDPTDASSSSAVHCQSGSRTRPVASHIFQLPIHLCSWHVVLLGECLLS